MSVQEALEAFKGAGAQLLERGPEDDAPSPASFKEDAPPQDAKQSSIKQQYQSDPGLQNVLLVVVGAPLTYAILRDGFEFSTGTSLAISAGMGLAFYRGYVQLLAGKTSDLMGQVGENVPAH